MKIVLAACVVCCIFFFHAQSDAQTTAQSAPPLNKLVPDAIANIALGGNKNVTANCFQGLFDRVGLQPNQVVSLSVQLPVALAGRQIIIESLDGGLVSGTSATVAIDGTLALQFQAGSQPGRYRINLRSGPLLLGLEFYVLDPTQPENNPAVINPGP
jgi:hypothetical protein